MLTQEAARWLTMQQATLLLGLSHDTVRRRIKRGELEARLVRTRHGPAYEVRVDGAAAPLPAPPDRADLAALVAELHRELISLAERCGHLEAELERARACIRELEG